MKYNLPGGIKDISSTSTCLRKMKLTIFLVILGIHMAFAHTVLSQGTALTVKLENMSIKTAIREIEKNSDYVFVFSDNIETETERKVSLHTTGESIEKVLADLLSGTKLSYRILDKQIVIYRTGEKKAPLEKSPSQPSVQQKKKISGTVTDTSTGETLIGVSITVKGTANGTITDVDGSYTLEAEPGQTLVFSYIGYRPQEITVGKQSVISIRMGEDVQNLNEVVVVGYGAQKKAHLTGAVASVNGDELTSRKSADVMSSLQGVLPGVAVLRSGGRPGAETSGIRVRGFSSTNTAEALILIDGVEGNLTTLNPDDIESISVLKDAAASAIYGARAAAGVVLVTTKKGTAGQKVKVTYNGSFGFNTPTYMPERLPAWEEQDMINISRLNTSINTSTGVATGTAEMDPERTSWIGNPNYNYRPNGARWEFFQSTNWMEEGLDDYGYTHNHSISVSGGSEKTRYYLSGGYYSNNGIIKYGPDGNTRTNLRLTLNTELSKYVSADVMVSYQGNTVEQNARGSNSILGTLYTARGRQPVYNPEEDSNYEINPYNADLQVNAIDIMKNGGIAKSNTEYFTGKLGLKLKNFVKGLTVDLNFSRRASFYNYKVNKRELKWPGKDGQGQRQTTGTNYATKTKYNANLDKLEALVNYEYKLAAHTFHVLGGASYEQYKKDQMSATAYNMLSNDFYSFNFYENSEAANSTLSDLVQPWKMGSLFGRIDYNYAERYLFEAVVRYDGSSRLAPGRRWDVFPSVSAGWRISEEKWFEPLRSYVSNLKLRGSWGELGNSSALSSYFPYLGLISNKNNNTSSASTIKVLGNPAYWQSVMVSEDLTWEILESTNIGVDLGMFDGRFNLGFDYYWKRNKNMMTDIEVGSIVGVDTPYQNSGELKTWGWELSLNWNHQIGNVSYQVGFNIDDPQNKLTRFEGANVVSEGTVDHLEGYPLNTIWGYKTDGYWSSRQEYLDYKAANPGYSSFSDNQVTAGDVKYLTQGKADHTVGVGEATPEDSGDLVCLGSANGRYLFGFNLSAQWKGFDISMDFQGVGKRKFLIDAASIAPLAVTYEMPWTIHRDYWREDNPDAFFPRIVSEGTFNYKPSDKWLQNGAYIRLKNVQVGYTIPVPKKYIENLRVYIAGTDVWEHSKVLSVYDPEIDNKAKKSSYYPFFRTWTTGINLTF